MKLTLNKLSGLRIAGTGSAFPEKGEGVPGRVSTVQVFEHVFGAERSDELLLKPGAEEMPLENWGVGSRAWSRWPGSKELSSNVVELAVAAARGALRDAKLEASEVEVLVVAGSTPARISRSTASLVAAELGLDAACYDVKSGGAGGLTAWLDAAGMLQLGARRALVVASEAPSSYLSKSDLVGCLLYGDAAGALVLERVDGYAGGLIAGTLSSVQASGVPFTIPGSLPPTEESVRAREFVFQREDAEYREELARCWAALASQLAASAPTPDWFLPYGVHKRQVESAAESLGVALDKTRTTLLEHGCVGCAGPLVALHELRSEVALEPGTTIATCAVAGGIHMVGFHWEL